MAEKRELQMKEITEQLEQGVKELFTSEMYTEYLRTMSQFHNYSFNNTLLIAMQKPMFRRFRSPAVSYFLHLFHRSPEIRLSLSLP